MDSDEALLERTRCGDAPAFTVLATRYWDSVNRVAWHMLADVPAAAKVAEATFLAVLQAGDAFPARVPFRTSLYRVAMGESWRRLGSAPSRAGGSLDALLPKFDASGRFEPLAGHAAGGVAEGSAGASVRDVLQRLEVLDRAAFVLRELEQLSPEEAAAILGIEPASIRRRTHRVLLLLTGLPGRRPGALAAC